MGGTSRGAHFAISAPKMSRLCPLSVQNTAELMQKIHRLTDN